MNKIQATFHNKKAFVAYLMAGDPSLERSAQYILELQAAGADLIEVGIPFSDPIAEGEVIQRANIRALSAGATLEGVFGMLESIKDQLTVPVVFLTYVNPVFVYGYHRFFQRSRDCGICGIILPDMPFEEQGEARDIAGEYGIDVITLVAPTSRQRTAEIAATARGFIYLVSSLGVTGVRSEITTDLGAITREIKKATELPVAVGFGIATPEQAAAVSAVADGVIVGSAIVRLIEEHGENAAKPLADYVAAMKAATR